MKTRPDDRLPLKPVELHILVALLEKDVHGYAIVQDIEERTGGAIRLVPGNLYPILRRLVRDGLLAERDGRPEDEPEHSQRRYYSLTPLGRQVTAAELRRLKSLMDSPVVADLLESTSGG